MERVLAFLASLDFTKLNERVIEGQARGILAHRN